MTQSHFDQVQEAVKFLKNAMDQSVKNAAILGTGLGGFIENIDIQKEIPYEEIPYFPKTTVDSHAGKLVIGHLNQTPIIVMSGRFHYYEGYSMKEVTFPIRVFQRLGIQNLYITNVAGGTNPDFNAGDLVIIRDHIYKMPDNPLRGKNDERFGPRFPDLKNTYCTELRSKAHKIASQTNMVIKEGVYYALPGPNLETPAEYEMIHRMGGDLVGMSTIPEVLVAKHGGLNIFAVSIVSNVCYPLDRITETTIESVMDIAERSGSKLSTLLTALIS
ncbi:purine-nucleoside phosphorylase [Portibacter marinus]|uniref:purine-nucleoside phosphorylase n=1 Tax=Portibacter marinus TaxID=2898660 RepID=UPI001F44F48A|nr:purine-nucleoside phosphorylase [Portibacter marinus]